jgi:hypothetical protein
MISWIILAVLVVLLYFAIKQREGFVPEFLEQSGVKRTVSLKNSSYAQTTNHMIPVPGPNIPIQGTESPFRVGIANAFIV